MPLVTSKALLLACGSVLALLGLLAGTAKPGTVPAGFLGSRASLQTRIGLHPCNRANPALKKLLASAAREDFGDRLLPSGSTDFAGFLDELKESLEKHHLPLRPLDHLFLSAEQPDNESRVETVHPSCAGDFMEFGVFQAVSTNKTARWRKQHCHSSCPAVMGFDTFEGLPEVWEADTGDDRFKQGAFSLRGEFPPVEENIHLIKGLFSDSLPPLLRLQRDVAGHPYGHVQPLSYLHIDCDLYAGAKDAFTLLSHKIVPGTIILFDELVNYRNYRDHEVKAFWEWLHISGAKVATIGMQGPLPGRDYAFDKDISVREHDQSSQSAAFVVVHKPASVQTLVW